MVGNEVAVVLEDPLKLLFDTSSFPSLDPTITSTIQDLVADVHLQSLESPPDGPVACASNNGRVLPVGASYFGNAGPAMRAFVNEISRIPDVISRRVLHMKEIEQEVETKWREVECIQQELSAYCQQRAVERSPTNKCQKLTRLRMLKKECFELFSTLTTLAEQLEVWFDARLDQLPRPPSQSGVPERCLRSRWSSTPPVAAAGANPADIPNSNFNVKPAAKRKLRRERMDLAGYANREGLGPLVNSLYGHNTIEYGVGGPDLLRGGTELPSPPRRQPSAAGYHPSFQLYPPQPIHHHPHKSMFGRPAPYPAPADYYKAQQSSQVAQSQEYIHHKVPEGPPGTYPIPLPHAAYSGHSTPRMAQPYGAYPHGAPQSIPQQMMPQRPVSALPSHHQVYMHRTASPSPSSVQKHEESTLVVEDTCSHPAVHSNATTTPKEAEAAVGSPTDEPTTPGPT